MRWLTHILWAMAMGLTLIGCDIYSDEDVAGGAMERDGMRVTFTISSGNPEFSTSRASSYGNPSLENGTEWENYVNLAGKDYLFYLFDQDGVFQEILSVKSISTTDNITYSVTADVKEKYSNFTIMALVNWGSSVWNMLSNGFAYPVLEKGVSKIDAIWTTSVGLRVYDTSSKNFMPSQTSHIPMYGARTYSLSAGAFNSEEIDLGAFYLIRALAKIDVYVAANSGITLNNVQLNCYSNYFHCAPVGMTAMNDEWGQATDNTMNMNLLQESFSPSTLDFVKIEENLYRLYVPEYPNKRNDVESSTISVLMTKNDSYKGGTITFEGMETTSSATTTPLNILRNNYYKFCITGITEYETNIVIDVVPFDNVSNDLVFE